MKVYFISTKYLEVKLPTIEDACEEELYFSMNEARQGKKDYMRKEKPELEPIIYEAELKTIRAMETIKKAKK